MEKWERRERKRINKARTMKKHGRSLLRIYKDSKLKEQQDDERLPSLSFG